MALLRYISNPYLDMIPSWQVEGGSTCGPKDAGWPAHRALLELLATYLGLSAAVQRAAALHEPTLGVLFGLLWSDSKRPLALGMVRPFHPAAMVPNPYYALVLLC